MNKKYFTLIYGDKISAAPQKKIIPSEDFSSLVSATEVLEHVQEDAKKYRTEVTQECEKIKESSYREGYAAGYEAWAEQLSAFEAEIAAYKKEIEKLIIPIALKAARKIIGREIELSENAIVDIVKENLKAVAQHKKISIFVNRKDFDVLEENKNKLKEVFENLESFTLRPRDDIAPHGCVIETEIGIVNAQLEHRWHVLEKAFKKLIGSNEAGVKE